jgi:hypothetical protein
MGTIQAVLAVVCVASYFFTWWEIGENGLVQRQLWGERTIPWNEITRVGPWSPTNRPMRDWLEVDYSRPAPMSDRGELRIRPAERDALVSALHAHAPHADFEVSPAEI